MISATQSKSLLLKARGRADLARHLQNEDRPSAVSAGPFAKQHACLSEPKFTDSNLDSFHGQIQEKQTWRRWRLKLLYYEARTIIIAKGYVSNLERAFEICEHVV